MTSTPFNPIGPTEKWVKVTDKIVIDPLDRRFTNLRYNLETGEFADAKDNQKLSGDSKTVINLGQGYPEALEALAVLRRQYMQYVKIAQPTDDPPASNRSTSRPPALASRQNRNSAPRRSTPRADNGDTPWVVAVIAVTSVAALFMFGWSYLMADKSVSRCLADAIYSGLGVGVVAVLAVLAIKWQESRRS